MFDAAPREAFRQDVNGVAKRIGLGGDEPQRAGALTLRGRREVAKETGFIDRKCGLERTHGVEEVGAPKSE